MSIFIKIDATKKPANPARNRLQCLRAAHMVKAHTRRDEKMTKEQITRRNVFLNAARLRRDAFARNGNDDHLAKAEALEAKAAQ
jgi:hypothetical protein